jgi:ABC-type transport system substrate-binding protein
MVLTNTEKAKARKYLRENGWKDASMVLAGKKHELWTIDLGAPGKLAPMSLEYAIKMQQEIISRKVKT